ncbi:DNA-binding transcriptional regulator, AcrR family [Parapedobacter composti]|uniref:DNA-binding transcriptional regulator, AcrR family n=1 Tax=Parapedobacter composti TaxID=623281 RepID=A0A1I1FGW7_9SPHI|nr:TetR/AcrR family transcriptional regulator [Parapedobacter composti]SFB96300.1 DNA-binding transcriptional regulator, AcrR family [Parapedobacter composti]
MSKTRKRYQGEINDKNRSKHKLINAVGEVIEKQGYTGLTSTNIAKAAGMSRRAISLYFGTVENLIEIYVKGKDYWVGIAEQADLLDIDKQEKDTRKVLECFLLNQFRYFYNNREMQKIVAWQISEPSDIMLHVCDTREKVSEFFFKLSDKELDGKNIDLRAVAALLVGGIYHLVLHAKNTDSLFCELDINNQTDFQRIEKAISLVLKLVYDLQP